MNNNNNNTWARRLEKKLAGLEDDAGEESIRPVASWIGFNRKHAPAFAAALGTALLSQQRIKSDTEHNDDDDDDDDDDDPMKRRQRLYWRVVHEVMIMEKERKTNWEKLEELRACVGETVLPLLPLMKALGSNVPGDLDAWLQEWEDLGVFDGEPSLLSQIRKLRDRRRKNRPNSPMKVTLLSGFLGAGKTTLLKRILRLNDQLPDGEKLRMAVIVNDMGEINLDAEEIKSSKVVREDAEMVEMHNGCICCTLRGDLFKTVKALSEENSFDYLVIESTGIGEPLPVAQTFAMDVDSMAESNAKHRHNNKHDRKQAGEDEKEAGLKNGIKKLTVAADENKSLYHYAKLDTLVTVVDSLNIYDVLGSIETLADKGNVSGMLGNTGASGVEDGADAASRYPGGEKAKKKHKEMAIEVAKAMPLERLRKALAGRKLDATGSREELVQRLVEVFEKQQPRIFARRKDDRPIAKLMLDQIEFANVIVVSKAKQFLDRHDGTNGEDGPAKLREIESMLRKLNPGAKVIVPSEDVYGDLDVSKELIDTGLFNMKEASSTASWAEELEAEEHNPETLEYGISSTAFVSRDMPFHPERLHKVLMVLFNDMKIRAHDPEKQRFFRGVVRTKGQIWLANMRAFPMLLQTVGHAHIELKRGDEPYLCERPNFAELVADGTHDAMVGKGLWTEKWGDRRSQLVFIGRDLDAAEIQRRLRAALLTEEESAELGGVEKWRDLPDPFGKGKLVKFCDQYYEKIAKQTKAETASRM